MEKNEIKKDLYKKNPKATFRFISKGIAYYYTDLEKERINFQIPVSDMGDADLNSSMNAKHLIRWII